MKTILVLRHAKSSWSHTGLSDHDRPLNDRGEGDAPRMGELLKREDLVPDLIISSTAVRAKTTAKLVAEAAGYEGKIQATRDFYHADADDIIETLKFEVSDENDIVMVVGHNPTMEELIEALTAERERVTTANIAHITLPIESWEKIRGVGEGRLVEMWRPKEL